MNIWFIGLVSKRGVAGFGVITKWLQLGWYSTLEGGVRTKQDTSFGELAIVDKLE